MKLGEREGLLQSEENELAAWRDMAAAAPEAWARAHGLTHASRGRAFAVGLRDLPAGIFNRAFGLAHDAPVSDEEIAWAGEVVSGNPPWLQPLPGEFEAGSIARLQQRGFTQIPMRWAKLARSLRGEPVAVPQGKFTLREVGAGEGELFGRTLAGAMGLPPWMGEWSPHLAGRPGWHLYVACDEGGRAVSCAALFMNGASAWLGMAATFAQARNQGAQRSLMLKRLADAQRWGATSATTETGEPMPGQPSPSFHNMIGCGFAVCGYRTNWKAPASNS